MLILVLNLLIKTSETISLGNNFHTLDIGGINVWGNWVVEEKIG